MNNKLTKLMGAVLLFSTISAYGATPPAQIPQTGQTVSYAASDDGALRKGTPGTTSATRFVVGSGAESSCVTDKQTGLMWVKDLGTVNNGAIATWDNAMYIAGNGTWCGHNDWRLPNRNELKSLVNYGATNQATWLIGQGFLGVQTYFYWSSTTYASSTSKAWTVDMTGGSVISNYDKENPSSVWPVRGGQ